MSPNSLPGSVKRYMRAQACKGLDAHMVDVICWSLLQTRRCCVELTNSPVSPAGVWFELSPLSPGLGAGKGKAGDTLASERTSVGRPDIAHVFLYAGLKCEIRLSLNHSCFSVSNQ